MGCCWWIFFVSQTRVIWSLKYTKLKFIPVEIKFRHSYTMTHKVQIWRNINNASKISKNLHIHTGITCCFDFGFRSFFPCTFVLNFCGAWHPPKFIIVVFAAHKLMFEMAELNNHYSIMDFKLIACICQRHCYERASDLGLIWSEKTQCSNSFQ